MGTLSTPGGAVAVALGALVAVLGPLQPPAALGAPENTTAATRLEPLPAAAFDRGAAAHLLSRTGFATTPAEIDRVAALGLEKAIDELFDASHPGADAVGVFEPSVKGFDRDFRELRKLSREERQKAQREYRRKDQRQLQQLRAWWFRRLVLGPDPLREKMTIFWHGHFATSQQTVRNSYHIYLQNEMLRANALGNFKELARKIARDPAMLRYLDNNRNIRRRPNENFARELMELFTLGRGNYTEKDIKESARAFTGWTFRGNEFIVLQRAHDPGEKMFLGKAGNFDGDDIIDIIFEQDAASRFVIRKLFVFFAHEKPSEKMIEALAATFRDSDFELEPVLAQLFRSAEFYSESSRATRIKSPVELVAGTLKLLGVDPGKSPAPALLAGRMGQELFLPPNVKGWDGGRAWISTTTLFDRYNFSRALLSPEPRRAPLRRRPNDAEQRQRMRDRATFTMPRWNAAEQAREILGGEPDSLDADVVVDRLTARFLLVPVSAEARNELIEFYRESSSRTRLRELIHLILSSPEYQVG